MKLNNKGFAFSTMLYGVLALITIILYAILSIQKSSSDETYYYSEIIEERLNECIEEEIKLENCYSSGNVNCDATDYHGCLGEITVFKAFTREIPSSVGEDGLYPDEFETQKYVFKGVDPNNYVEYLNKKWRVESIVVGGPVVMIDYEQNSSILNWDERGTINGDKLIINSNMQVASGKGTESSPYKVK